MLKQLNDLTLRERCETSAHKSRERLSYLENELDKIVSKNDNKQSRTVKLTGLDLRKCETPLTTQKVTFKVHELAYKRNVELKLKEGTLKLSKIYKEDPQSGDKKNRMEVIQSLTESENKLQLLNSSLKEYQKLDIGIPAQEDEQEDMFVWRKPGVRRAISATLIILIKNIKGISVHKQQTNYIVVKVDSVTKAKTKITKMNRFNEQIKIEVDKACEIELLIYQIYEGKHTAQGLVWFTFSELLDYTRKTLIHNQEGWTSATNLNENTSSTMRLDANVQNNENNIIEGWFDVEPSGAIELKIEFNKATHSKKKLSKLGRKNAVRKNRGEIVVQNGHTFVPLQFFQLMTCALCNEFLMNNVGYQCDDCQYFCHQRCVSKVVTKCMSKSANELLPTPSSTSDEDKLNHKIPHRFEDVSNIGANWCCHCGYMLAFGKRNSKRCSECNITCHNNCMPLVPDFCGMSMLMANEILMQIKNAKEPKKQKSITKSLVLPHSPKKDPKPVQENITPQQTPSTPASTTKRLSLSMHYFKQSKKKEQQDPKKQLNIMSIDHFTFLAVLGKGNFGKVMLAEEKKTHNYYAIKVLKKDFILESDEIEGTKSEKRVFITANNGRHPFLVGLHSCFQTSSRIYFVMEYISGGDLMWHIQHQPFDEHRAK